jgi:HSP20 family protein
MAEINTENKNPVNSNQSLGQTNKQGTSLDFWSGKFPSVEITEKNKEVCVKADIPGLSDKDIQVTVQKGCLVIKGEKKEDHEEKNEDTYYSESFYGSFSRSIPLDPGLDWDKASAKCLNGQLIVSIPKIAGAETQTGSKKIEIN